MLLGTRKFKNFYDWHFFLYLDNLMPDDFWKESVKDGDEAAGQDRGPGGDQSSAAQGDFPL